MMEFPRNVKLSQRMQVIDISDVEIVGVLRGGQGVYGDTWTQTHGENVADLSEWLDAFEGKNVTVTIKLTFSDDEGVKLHKKPMERNNDQP